jgi:hypothetical protein
MKLALALLAVSTTATLALAGCDDPNSLLGGGRSDPAASIDPTTALQCTDKPTGRSYASFDGSKLEAKRANEAASANLARFKPYGVLAGEYQRLVGNVPAALAGAAASFDAPPDRWFAEPTEEAVSLSTAFDLSFDACRIALANAPDRAAAPTAESAQSYCSATMRKAWSRSPSPEEVGACVDLATQKLGTEPDPHRRWAYVCASILSSSNFLTY